LVVQNFYTVLGKIGISSEDVGSGTFNDGVFKVQLAADGALQDRLTISSRGAATFSSSITAASLSTSGVIDVGMSPAPFWNARFRDYSDGSGVYIGSVAAGGYKFISGDSYYQNSGAFWSNNTTSTVVNLTGGNFAVYTNSGLTANTNFTPSERFRINTSGQATFSNSITARDLFNLRGDSSANNSQSLITFTNLRSGTWNNAQIETVTGGQVWAGNLVFKTASVAYANVLSERLRITSEGYLGVTVTGDTVTSGDLLGVLSFVSKDASTYSSGGVANIRSYATSTYNTGNISGDLRFYVSDGLQNINADYLFGTEAMRIDQSGRIITTVSGVNGQLQVYQSDAGTNVDSMVYLHNNRNATSGYHFAKFFSGFPNNTQDVEFAFRGDGTGYSDGGWTSPASDYAEYFESVDGTALTIGVTVVLENGKIRQATESDTNIIGAIRPKNASLFLGNSAEHKWNQKYLKDDFGAYILDAEGMRALNPQYDPEVEYISREKRDEWNIVGLVGQVPILKSQPVDSSWVKMYDISTTVEMWLIK
jgi:hypothetical protein